MSKVLYSMLSSFAVVIVVLSYVDYSSAANCDNIVFKESEGVLNWLGNVSFTVPRTVSGGWTAVANFDQPFTGVGVWVLWVESNGAQGISVFTNRDENADLRQGDIFKFRFRINYGQNIPQPKLISFRFEDIELCA